MDSEKNTSSAWLQRVEDLINVLEGSSVGELKLTEGETEIIIRRSPHMVLTAVPTIVEMLPGLANSTPGNHTPKVARSWPVFPQLTGVYYSPPYPTQPPLWILGEI